MIKIFSFFDNCDSSSTQGRLREAREARNRNVDQFQSTGEKGKTPEAILAQFHAAEYSAMMARVSAWANLQYAPWPILVAALGLVSQWQAAVNVRIWAGVILALVVYVAYQGTMVNSLYYVLLIERHLRPRASRLVQTDEFWIHERVFQKIFPQNPGWWPYWPPVLSFAIIGLAAGWSWYTYSSHDWTEILKTALVEFRAKSPEYSQGGLSDASAMALEALASAIGFVASIGLVFFIIVLTRSGKRLKDDIVEACNKSKIVIDESRS